MTKPNLELQLKSVKQALEALEVSKLPKESVDYQNQLTVVNKPNGSRVKVKKTSQMLEIVIPQRGNLFLIPVILFLLSTFMAFINPLMFFIDPFIVFIYRDIVYIYYN